MKALSFVALLIVLCVGWYFYTHSAAGKPTSLQSARSTIDITAVKNDLIAIAQAERGYQAEHGAYTDIADLMKAGNLNLMHDSRGPYIYSSDASATDFHIYAKCVTANEQDTSCNGVPQQLSIDPTMQISQQ